jgi:hypothetical protein
VVSSHRLEFDAWFAPDARTPPEKLAQVYHQFARRLGATPEVLEVLRQLKVDIDEKEISTMTTKAAADAPRPTFGAPAKAASETKDPKPGTAPSGATAVKKPAAGKRPPEAPVKPATQKPSTAAKPAAVVQKPAAAKPAAAADKAKKPSAGARFCELIMANKLTDDEIFAKVKAEFGLDDKKRSYVGWYRNDLKKKGQNPPAPVQPKAVKAGK